jgi:hypothetical protein
VGEEVVTAAVAISTLMAVPSLAVVLAMVG